MLDLPSSLHRCPSRSTSFCHRTTTLVPAMADLEGRPNPRELQQSLKQESMEWVIWPPKLALFGDFIYTPLKIWARLLRSVWCLDGEFFLLEFGLIYGIAFGVSMVMNLMMPTSSARKGHFRSFRVSHTRAESNPDASSSSSSSVAFQSTELPSNRRLVYWKGFEFVDLVCGPFEDEVEENTTKGEYGSWPKLSARGKRGLSWPSSFLVCEGATKKERGAIWPSARQGKTRKINFCQLCGGPTKHEIPDGEEKMRPICTLCGRIAYENPKMVR
ncbi:hypothetical protein TEA_005676 [Camellia sinensis var. sinensis]|uniref:Nudix hydrolase N-terminal domain-containing protein n=1 Tax=Camellia sinensis var. sinensis TaxID=542762 RepID=A0A4S4EI99_CAMSN|nr:hypothetical protein TEA_005676 [Camellia sinensis var. sinensis]